MNKREVVTLHYEVRSEVAISYEVDPDHFKQTTGTALYDATARELENYVMENRIITAEYDYSDEETLQDDWTLED